MEADAPELNVPTIWETEKQLSPVGLSVYQMLAVQAFRPDRLYAAANNFVSSVSIIVLLPSSFLCVGWMDINLRFVNLCVGCVFDCEIVKSP